MRGPTWHQLWNFGSSDNLVTVSGAQVNSLGARARGAGGDMSRPGTTRGSSYPFLQRGLPFFAFMIGGSYGISILLQVRTHSHIPSPFFLLPWTPPRFGHPACRAFD